MLFRSTESTLSNIVDPRFNDELYGFDKIEKMFLNVIRNEKLSNAYIFYGIKGVGKATFAFRLARFILNEDKKFDNKLFISKDNKIYTVFDEIKVGLGRAGQGNLFCFEKENVIPDVVTISNVDVIEVSGGTNSGLFSESKGLNFSIVSHEKKINTIPRMI